MNEEPRRSGWWRRPLARLLTVLGVLLIVVSIAANFVERQALDRSELEETARQLIDDEVIQQQIAVTLTDELFRQVDVQAALEERLPPEQQGLAGPIAGALRPLAERISLRILDGPRFQELWVTAVGAAQAQVVRVLDDEAVFIETEGGVVALDLRPLLVELTNQLPIAPNLADRLPEDAGVITVFEADQLQTAQDLTRLLRFVADWIWVLALLFWVAAVFIARDRRKEVRAVAIGFVLVGLLVLLIRRIAGNYLVDELSTSPASEDAIDRSWEIITRILGEAGWAAIALGIVALLGVWLVGPGARAAHARGWLAPYLRRPEWAYGGAAFAFLLLLLWSPLSYIQRWSSIIVLAVLAAAGIELLRRMTGREFPDAEPSGVPPLRLGGGTSQADELERLARMRADGALTEEEFAAAKARLLGSG
jgi:Short C-terminal domain